MKPVLVIDTETGGLDCEKHSLLSLAAVVYADGMVRDQLYLLIKEDDIVAEESALKVNGLSLDMIREEGFSPKEAVASLENFLDEHRLTGRIRVVAHNAAFDIGYLKRLYKLAGKNYGKRFSYQYVCTYTGAFLFEMAGLLKLEKGSASLDNMIKLFGIKLDRSEGHNALNDAVACAELLGRYISMLRHEGKNVDAKATA